MPDVTPALAVLGGSGWDIQKPSKYVGGNQEASFTWLTKPAANAVPFGTRIRITDVGVSPGILLVSDGTQWLPDGEQLLGRGGVALSVTGTLAETVLATVTVPAGAMGINGGLHVHSAWSYTNSANNKQLRAKLGGLAGTSHASIPVSTTAGLADMRRVRNRGAANSQVGSAAAGASAFSLGGSGPTVSAIDTSVAQDVVFTGTLALVGETITLESYEVWLTP